LLRVQAIILERERATGWVGELASGARGAK
jgi:hypothetical protein